MSCMHEGKTWTADELLAMTPDERHEVVQASTVVDLSQVPPELLKRAQEDIRLHIVSNESSAPTRR